ncbi:hypothetical protein [Streptomyces sp. NPDC056723]|uniref:hypothetical protein n=1 Tax=Streptomyces sp. NPDC056723 TaxID=3345925 RepID=UPI0036895AF1
MRLLFDPESEVTDEEGTTALGVVGQPPHQEEEGDAFDATRDTLIRLVAEYWHEQQESAPSGQLTDTIDEFILTHVLDYRHHGTVDGRLALWRQEHVRAVLLEWLPRHVTVLPDEAAEHDAPAAVAALVDFLAAAGVLDPRSDDPGRLRTLAKELRSAHEEAMQDPRFMGPAKFWMLTAARNGVDVRNKRALDRFLADARAGRVPYGEEQLAQVMENQFTGFFGRALDTGAGPGGRSLLQERALPLPVVVLGEEEELRRTAAGSGLLGQLDEVARWLGTEGRPVTKTGRLKVADALALARHLGTDRGRGEAAGPLIHLAGDTWENIRRADQLPMLRLLVDWARQARLIRVYRGRLVAVAGARAVREDPLALAVRALAAFPELRDPLLMGPVWDVPSDLYPRFDLLLTDVLAALYGMPAAMPWPVLWQSVRDSYLGDDGWFATPEARQASHRRSAAELYAVIDLLAEVGMVTFERGTPAALFHESLRDLNEPEHPEPADASVLSDGSDGSDGSEDLAVRDDVELVRLTELGTYAVRALLTSLDRSAPAVGDLRDADASRLCAALLDEYDPASARAELAEWIAARGGWNSARPAFTEALRRTRLHSRRHALLRLLAEELPDGHGPEFLRTLRYEEELRPSALFMAQAQAQAAAAALSAQGSAGRDVADAAARADEDLDDHEIALTAAESLLLMRETGGEEALLEQVGHSSGDAAAFATMLDVALASGHPDQAGLERLSRIDVAALRRRAARLGRLRADAARRHKSGGARKRKKRR